MYKNQNILGLLTISVIGILFFLTTLFIGCAPEIEDTSIHRKWLDSLERIGKDSIRIEMDSLCEIRREKFIKNAVDSIMGERLEEMRQFDQ